MAENVFQKEYSLPQANLQRKSKAIGIEDNRPLSLSFMQLKKQIQSSPVMQMQTEIHHRTGAFAFEDIGPETVGVGMEARLDPDDPVIGSEPGANQAQLIKRLNKFYNVKFIRGHLLNADLGGGGIGANMFPITDQANKNHSNLVEQPIKAALCRAGTHHMDVYYKVEVGNIINENKQENVAGEDSSIPYQISTLASDFRCNAKFIDKPGTVATPDIIPETIIHSEVYQAIPLSQQSVYPPCKTENYSVTGGVRPLRSWKHEGEGRAARYTDSSGNRVKINDAPLSNNPLLPSDLYELIMSSRKDEIVNNILETIPRDDNMIKPLAVLKKLQDPMRSVEYLSASHAANEALGVDDFIAGSASQELNSEIVEDDLSFYNDVICQFIDKIIDENKENYIGLVTACNGDVNALLTAIVNDIQQKLAVAIPME